ncbi:MAG: hypothetical protein MJ178_06805 [Treponemataceae bacterium]|nr:hypothetical protein [Treponemataceae bacterium]
MTSTVILTAVIRLLVGGVAAFCAIILWPRLRDAAWMCIIAGVIVTYGGIVYDMLILFGVLRGNEVVVSGISIIPLAFELLPLVLYSIGFIIMSIKKRKF